MKILGVIPARGGSKALPGKNVKTLAGKPLIRYPWEAANASGVLDRVVLSTDDPDIAETAKGFGLEVPFLRPEAERGAREHIHYHSVVVCSKGVNMQRRCTIGPVCRHSGLRTVHLGSRSYPDLALLKENSVPQPLV